jgi:phosphomannomutase
MNALEIHQLYGPETRFCAIDGDADRLIYFKILEDKTISIFDGDRIMALMAYFIHF